MWTHLSSSSTSKQNTLQREKTEMISSRPQLGKALYEFSSVWDAPGEQNQLHHFKSKHTWYKGLSSERGTAHRGIKKVLANLLFDEILEAFAPSNDALDLRCRPNLPFDRQFIIHCITNSNFKRPTSPQDKQTNLQSQLAQNKPKPKIPLAASSLISVGPIRIRSSSPFWRAFPPHHKL